MTSTLRFRVTAALVALLAVMFVGAGCGSDGDPEGSREARTLLQRAFEGTSAVEGGHLTLEMKADVEGIDSLEDPLEVRLEGPFKSHGKGKLPSVDWDIDFEGGGQKLAGGVIATQDNAFLTFQGRSYELGRESFAGIARRLELSKPDRLLTPGGLGLDPASWLEDPEVGDGEEIGGEATRKISGAVNVRKAAEDMIELLDSPEVREQLKRPGGGGKVPTLTDNDLEEIEDAIERMDVELNVDDDDVLRRLYTEIDLNAQGGGDGKDLRGRLSFTYVLRKVGTNPVIRAPSGARPLRELLAGLGLGGLGAQEEGKPDDAFGPKGE